MDVTCLRPFNVSDPYMFRSHRIGVMGNIMKCPRHSDIMAKTYDRTLAVANRQSEWLVANRILSAQVRLNGLSNFIRHDFCNEDSWDIIVPMLEKEIEIPKHWHGIHWLNEVHRTIRDNRG